MGGLFYFAFYLGPARQFYCRCDSVRVVCITQSWDDGHKKFRVRTVFIMLGGPAAPNDATATESPYFLQT